MDSIPLLKALTAGANGVVYDRTSAEGLRRLAGPLGRPPAGLLDERHGDYRRAVSQVWSYCWQDAAALCKWLSEKEGKPACLRRTSGIRRAGGDARPFSSGVAPPAVEIANAWVLKNMHGGFAEWVLDRHRLYPAGPPVDPVGPATGFVRMVRGGGLDYRQSKTDAARICRRSCRTMRDRQGLARRRCSGYWPAIRTSDQCEWITRQPSFLRI